MQVALVLVPCPYSASPCSASSSPGSGAASGLKPSLILLQEELSSLFPHCMTPPRHHKYSLYFSHESVDNLRIMFPTPSPCAPSSGAWDRALSIEDVPASSE